MVSTNAKALRGFSSPPWANPVMIPLKWTDFYLIINAGVVGSPSSSPALLLTYAFNPSFIPFLFLITLPFFYLPLFCSTSSLSFLHLALSLSLSSYPFLFFSSLIFSPSSWSLYSALVLRYLPVSSMLWLGKMNAAFVLLCWFTELFNRRRCWPGWT